jgi:hypothetical protein
MIPDRRKIQQTKWTEAAVNSPAEAVFGAPIVLPNEFLQNEELPVDAIIKNFLKTLHAPAVSLPKHNSSAQLPDECGRRHSERYDNTGLLTVTYQLIYRHCTCTAKVSWSTSRSV